MNRKGWRGCRGLFTLTRADAGQYPLQLQSVYLDELAADVMRRARTLAMAKKIASVCRDRAGIADRGGRSSVAEDAAEFVGQRHQVHAGGRTNIAAMPPAA